VCADPGDATHHSRSLCGYRRGVLTCVYSFVNLEVLGAREHLAAGRVRARERFLAGVHADVIDELVLGLERLVEPVTAAPVARVVVLLRSADVVDGQVRDELHDRREPTTTFSLTARLALHTQSHHISYTSILAATLRGSRPGVQSASLIMTSLLTS